MRQLVLVLLLLNALFVCGQPVGKWESKTAPYYRHVNGVQMLDSKTFVGVGGNERNDSIRMIVKTTDGGYNWNNFTDAVNQAWLKAVHFPLSQVGYAAGSHGMFNKTINRGDSWAILPLPANLTERDYNTVFFTDEQTGYLGGGLKDTFQTILKTTDGGANWVALRDTAGGWIKSIYFINRDTGFAVGAYGVVYKTTNAGAVWNAIALPGSAAQRTYNAVMFFTPAVGILAGGNEANDSIQTILRTTDGGNTWNFVTDVVAPWLNGLGFVNADSGYAVGDDATVLFTGNRGVTWGPVAIDDSIKETAHLRSISFVSPYYGVIGGAFGKIIVYKTDSVPVPSAGIFPVTYLVQPTRVQLNGIANANDASIPVSAMFEYGLTTSLGDSIAAVPNGFIGMQNQNVSAALSGLAVNTLYYYRLRVSNVFGTVYSVVDSFNSSMSVNEIANWSFEFWDSVRATAPSGWFFIGDVSKVSTPGGGNAAKIVSIAEGPGYKTSGVLIGIPGDEIVGGAPFAAHPDSIKVLCNYSIMPGDSALVIALFKKGGSVIAQNLIFFTGNSSGNFDTLTFALDWADATIPDTIIFGIASSNPFHEDVTNFLNTVTVDKVWFTGTTVNLPNAGFDNWVNVDYEVLRGWASDDANIYGENIQAVILKTTDSYAGNFAVEMRSRSIINGGDGKNISMEAIRRTGYDVPSFPVYHRPLSLNGYYKYMPLGRDSVSITAGLFYQGTSVGYSTIWIDSATSSYKPFTVPFFYSNFPGVPDSARIQISTGNGNIDSDAVFILDALSFDGFIDTNYVDTNWSDIKTISVAQPDVKLFPNPAENILQIWCEGFNNDHAEICIYDVSGGLIARTGTVAANQLAGIDVSKFAPGIYFVNIHSSNISVTRKFIRRQ